MGYTTRFTGRFELDRQLDEAHGLYLRAFSDSRRMKRDARETEKMMDPLRDSVGLPVGVDGGYFVGNVFDGFSGQIQTPDVLEYNKPPDGQPGLWCKWRPSIDLKGIDWDGREKFYDYIEWLQYIIDHFLARWGYVLTGAVKWQGENDYDNGTILVKGNHVVRLFGE